MQQPGRAPTQGRTLIALFEGQQYPVTKEEFVIGRGQKTSDLTIRDSNVSRRHACVVLYNGQYWIVDQQSTNGVEFNGTKVDQEGRSSTATSTRSATTRFSSSTAEGLER
jgi:pSer/pThr/pTyr-binding forkhead associated (FHA) protein